MRTRFLLGAAVGAALLVGCNSNLVGSSTTNSTSSSSTSSSGLANCTDNALNSSSCATATGRYVTPTQGSTVNGSNGNLSETIPLGFYDGSTSCVMSDSNLVASNIVSGVSIFGVTGTAQIPACKTADLPYSYGNLSGYSCCGNSFGIVGDGTYIYVGETGMTGTNILLAFTFDTTTHAWTLKSDQTTYTAGNVSSMWDDGTYVYTCEGSSGLEAWTFNGSSWTKKGSYATSMSCNQLWGDGTYLYAADGANGLKAFSFNGSAFTLLADYGSSDVTGISVNSVWGDSHGIYISDSGNTVLRAVSYGGGASFTAGGTVSGVAANNVGGLAGDGTYIYLGSSNGTLYAYTYNGTSFTQAGLISNPDTGDLQQIYASSASPGVVYVANFGTAPWIWGFNGTNFTYEGMIPTQNNNYVTMWASGAYLYFTDVSTQTNNNLYVSAWPLCN